MTAPFPKLLEGDLRLIGSRWSPRVHQIKDFLSRSPVPFVWLDIDRDEEAKRTARLAVQGERILPILIFPDGTVLSNPDVQSPQGSLARERQSYELLDGTST